MQINIGIMRQYIDLITEASYDSMITALKSAYPEEQEAINSHVKWAKSVLKRDDRISWYLRLLKAYMIYQTTGKDVLTPLAGIPADVFVKSLNFSYVQDMIVHYFGYNIPAIDQYRFARQPVMTVNADLQDEVDKWERAQKKDKDILDLQPGDYELIKFPNGSAWIFVDRAYCEREGESGRHCGNATGRSRPNQRILSYRVDGRVLMTFILEEDGFLGEMKAKGNQKPSPDLHPYIVELLLNPIVKGIRAGGYLPENNFNIFDLNDRLFNRVRAARPEFIIQQLKVSPYTINRLDPKDLEDEQIGQYVVNIVDRYVKNNPNDDLPSQWIPLIENSWILLPVLEIQGNVLFQVDPARVTTKMIDAAMENGDRELIASNLGEFPAVGREYIGYILDANWPMAVANLPEHLYTERNINEWAEINPFIVLFLPEEYQSPELFNKLVSVDTYLLDDALRRWRKLPPSLFDERTLNRIPELLSTIYAKLLDKRRLSEKEFMKFAKLVVRRPDDGLKYVPKEYRTPELCKLAVERNLDNLQYVFPIELRAQLKQEKKTQLPENSLRRLIDLTSK